MRQTISSTCVNSLLSEKNLFSIFKGEVSKICAVYLVPIEIK